MAARWRSQLFRAALRADQMFGPASGRPAPFYRCFASQSLLTARAELPSLILESSIKNSWLLHLHNKTAIMNSTVPVHGVHPYTDTTIIIAITLQISLLSAICILGTVIINKYYVSFSLLIVHSVAVVYRLCLCVPGSFNKLNITI